jgi:N-acetylmuramoyl-L-alanine amidase
MVFNSAEMPTVIMEIACISNDSDRKNLMDEKFRNQAAQGLYDGIIKVLNEMAAAD